MDEHEGIATEINAIVHCILRIQSQGHRPQGLSNLLEACKALNHLEPLTALTQPATWLDRTCFTRQNCKLRAFEFRAPAWLKHLETFLLTLLLWLVLEP